MISYVYRPCNEPLWLIVFNSCYQVQYSTVLSLLKVFDFDLIVLITSVINELINYSL
jgi:hypothetical protein